MLYTVKVRTQAGDYWLARGELVEHDRATRFDSPSAAYRAASAYALVHLKKHGRCEVIRERRDMTKKPASSA